MITVNSSEEINYNPKNVLEEVSRLSGLKVVEVNVYVQNVKMEEIEQTTPDFED